MSKHCYYYYYYLLLHVVVVVVFAKQVNSTLCAL